MPRHTAAGPEPLHVSLVAIPEAVVSTMTGLFDVMNAFAMMPPAGDASGGAALPARPFQVEIVGLRPGPLQLASRVPVTVQRSVTEIATTDIVIAPSILLGPEGRRTGRHPELVERSEEHTSELQSLMRNPYAVFCLTKKNTI